MVFKDKMENVVRKYENSASVDQFRNMELPAVASPLKKAHTQRNNFVRSSVETIWKNHKSYDL